MLDPATLGLATMQGPGLINLGLAVMPNSRALGLMVMPNPRDLDLGVMLDSIAFQMKNRKDNTFMILQISIM